MQKLLENVAQPHRTIGDGYDAVLLAKCYRHSNVEMLIKEHIEENYSEYYRKGFNTNLPRREPTLGTLSNQLASDNSNVVDSTNTRSLNNAHSEIASNLSLASTAYLPVSLRECVTS